MFVPGPTRPAISSPRRARLVRKLSYWGERGDRVAHAPAVRRLILPTASLPYVRMVRDICASPTPSPPPPPPPTHPPQPFLFPYTYIPNLLTLIRAALLGLGGRPRLRA